MKFHEHIIRVGEPGLPGPSREDFWRGVVAFAKRPEAFYGEIASSELSAEESGENGERSFTRVVRFQSGGLAFEERVVLDDKKHAYRTFFKGDAERPASDFSIELAEPEPGSLFVRFTYNEEVVSGAPILPPMLAGLRKQAYEAKDMQVVEGILQFLARD